jgi:uncharacterized membrane-anchored protein
MGMPGAIAIRKMKSMLLIICMLFWFVSSASAQQASSNETLPENPAMAQEPNPTTPSNVPVGTAVAPVVPVTGVMAFSPAGAAIAPAKQHRTRTILISLGIVLGTAAAVGTVVALADASPSRPSGAR